MLLAASARLGPYQIVTAIGAGGMGEVYRARDTRLNRDVAVKILPPSFADDAERLRRFTLEAQSTGALNHSNILAIYDIGAHEGMPYIVSELLEGESLRDRLRNGKLSVSKSVDVARQVTAGLAAAHAKGITHRDIKPENIFITRDGRVKILDFGLAKMTQPRLPSDSATRAETVEMETTPGALLGTVAYMSPEQVRGLPADHRSDLFSVGCVLYEMLSGERPFRGETPADTMSAILKEEPPDFALSKAAVPPALDRVVRHCLEKDPEHRFQTARDLAFGLESLSQTSQTSGTSIAPPAPAMRHHRWALWSALCLLAIGLPAAGYFWGRSATGPDKKFHRVTFRRGVVPCARFAPDGNTIIYSAQWEDEPFDLFTARLDSPGSRPLGLTGATLLGVSSTGELLLSLNARVGVSAFAPFGMLARVAFSGGTPRPVEDRINFADWSPDGKEMALVRETDQGAQLEFPVGKVLYRTAGYISEPRISPSGELVAFLDHPLSNDNGGSVAVIDRSGRKRKLTGDYLASVGLAWSPKGDEIWFTAAKIGARSDLRAVTTSGRERVVYSQSASVVLHDISRDGRVLLTHSEARQKLLFRGAGEPRERELSWLDWSLLTDISRDGKLVGVAESGEGAGPNPIALLRESNGTPAITLGPGVFPMFTPDTRAAVTIEPGSSGVVIYPVGPGQPKHIPFGGFTISRAGLMPDGKTLWLNANESSHASRYYLAGLSGEKPRPVTAEGVRFSYPGITPDGQFLIGLSANRLHLYPVAGGQPQLLEGVAEGERIAGFSLDGQSFYVWLRNQVPARVYHMDRRTGRRELYREIAPTDRAGLSLGGGIALAVTPDGKSYAYSVGQQLDELHWVEGLNR